MVANSDLVQTVLDAGVETQLNMKDAGVLVDLARRVPSCGLILEIGAFKGFATCLLSLAADPSVRIVTVDPFNLAKSSEFTKEHGLYEEAWARNCARFPECSRVEKVKEYSHDLLQSWNQPIDLLFLDGDPSKEAAEIDLFGYVKHVVPGGMIAMNGLRNCVIEDGYEHLTDLWNVALGRSMFRHKDQMVMLAWGEKQDA
jgi:predicted O-methyltransferase YrrM